MNIIFFIFIVFGFFQVRCQDVVGVDYYWRDYHGIVPDDALPAGKDINGDDTYVGQIYLHGRGLFVAQISKSTEVDAPFYHNKRIYTPVKILCTQRKDDFYWLPTSWNTFHTDTINKHPVVGGYEFIGHRGFVNIGRLMHQGILKIGQVASYLVGNVWCHFIHKNRNLKVKNFEVLIYNKTITQLYLDVRTTTY